MRPPWRSVTDAGNPPDPHAVAVHVPRFALKSCRKNHPKNDPKHLARRTLLAQTANIKPDSVE